VLHRDRGGRVGKVHLLFVGEERGPIVEGGIVGAEEGGVEAGGRVIEGIIGTSRVRDGSDEGREVVEERVVWREGHVVGVKRRGLEARQGQEFFFHVSLSSAEVSDEMGSLGVGESLDQRRIELGGRDKGGSLDQRIGRSSGSSSSSSGPVARGWQRGGISEIEDGVLGGRLRGG
jgi:hypothetical protein